MTVEVSESTSTAAEAQARSTTRLAPGAVHGHRRPPRRRRFRARRDGRPLDRRGQGMARLLHERRPGRRGSQRRPARAGGRPRARAAGRRGNRRICRRGVLHQPDGALANDLALRELLVREIRTFRPDAVLATDPEVALPPRRRSQPTDHRAAGMAAVDAVYPAARNPMAFPWLARDGLDHRVGRLYLFWSDKPTARVDVTATIGRKIDALRAHASRSRSPRRSTSGSASGRPRRAAIGVEAAEAIRLIVIERRRGGGGDDAEWLRRTRIGRGLRSSAATPNAAQVPANDRQAVGKTPDLTAGWALRKLGRSLTLKNPSWAARSSWLTTAQWSPAGFARRWARRRVSRWWSAAGKQQRADPAPLVPEIGQRVGPAAEDVDELAERQPAGRSTRYSSAATTRRDRRPISCSFGQRRRRIGSCPA